MREDDGVGRAIIAALERELRDAELTVAEVASALRAVGDPERAWRLVEELRAEHGVVIVSPRV